MNTKARGDLAVGQAINYYLKNNYEVCLPIGDKRHYDLITEKGGKIQRIQVKFAGLYKNKNQCRVGLRITGGNQSYNYAKKYSDDAFDVLFIYTERNNLYEIPWKSIVCRNELAIENVKYNKYRIL